MGGIGIVILAAGSSTRLPQPKQLLSYCGQTLLRRAGQIAVASICRPVIVVLGAGAEALVPQLADLPVTVVENKAWRLGMSFSIRIGVKALEEKFPKSTLTAAVIMLCDQPLVTPEHVNRLVEVHQVSGVSIVASEYGGAPGVPALFSRKYFPTLRSLSGDEGAKQVLRKNHNEVTCVPCPNAAFDIDTPADYESLLRLGDPNARNTASGG
jgi:molybdenum cofactor cytidylyltransferase